MPDIGWLTATLGSFRMAMKPNWERMELRWSSSHRLAPARSSFVSLGVGTQRQEVAKKNVETPRVVVGARPKTEESEGSSAEPFLPAKVSPRLCRGEIR